MMLDYVVLKQKISTQSPMQLKCYSSNMLLLIFIHYYINNTPHLGSPFRFVNIERTQTFTHIIVRCD